jgi:hypothetical protein
MIGWVERFSADHRAGYGPAADIAADRRRCTDRILKFHIGEDKQSAGRIALTACRSALFGQRFAFGRRMLSRCAAVHAAAALGFGQLSVQR